MRQDPDTDDCIWCDVCGEVKRKLNYRIIRPGRFQKAVWICEPCEEDYDKPEECSVCHNAGGWTDALSGDWNICGHCQEAVR